MKRRIIILSVPWRFTIMISCFLKISFNNGTKFLRTYFLFINNRSPYPKINSMHYLLKTIFSTVLLSGSLFSFSQETPPIVREQWKNNPEIHTIPAEYAKEPAVIVYDF